MPRTTVPYRAVAPVISPAPAQVPMQTATIIGHKRRTTALSEGPASICQTLVRNDGIMSSAAASTGGMTMASNPIEIVGSPSPITPLMKPASRNTSPMKTVVPSMGTLLATRQPSPREHPFGSCEMRPIVHLAVERDHAGPGRGGEHGDDVAGMLDLTPARGEGRVDDLDLIGMDRELAREAVPRGGRSLGLEAVQVAKVDEDRIDRLHAGRDGREQAQVAREPIGRGQHAIGLPRRRRADLRREVLRAPG